MDMFPTSGAGLHVGHLLGYIGTDVYARYHRMTGHNVHTMGYDSFGLPAELYAGRPAAPRSPPRPTSPSCAASCGAWGWGHDSRWSVSTIDEGFYR